VPPPPPVGCTCTRATQARAHRRYAQVFSDFHVEDASNSPSTGVSFPAECAAGALTPQEKLLAFMLLDLTASGNILTCPDVPDERDVRHADGRVQRGSQ
jgi:hypothetical protein